MVLNFLIDLLGLGFLGSVKSVPPGWSALRCQNVVAACFPLAVPALVDSCSRACSLFRAHLLPAGLPSSAAFTFRLMATLCFHLFRHKIWKHSQVLPLPPSTFTSRSCQFCFRLQAGSAQRFHRLLPPPRLSYSTSRLDGPSRLPVAFPVSALIPFSLFSSLQLE